MFPALTRNASYLPMVYHFLLSLDKDKPDNLLYYISILLQFIDYLALDFDLFLSKINEAAIYV